MNSPARQQHTPGIWEVENPMDSDMGLWVVQDGLPTYQWTPIAIIQSNFDNADGSRLISKKEQAANARLIAAAPELLAALKGVVAVSDRATVEYDLARAAIARAEGRAE